MLPFAFPKPLFEFEAERPQIEPLFALLPTYSNLVQSTLCTSRRCLVMLFLHFVLFFCCHKWQHTGRVRRLWRRRTRASVIRVISSLRPRQADLRKPGEPRWDRSRPRSRYPKSKPKDRTASRRSHGRQRTATFPPWRPNSHRNSQWSMSRRLTSVSCRSAHRQPSDEYNYH